MSRLSDPTTSPLEQLVDRFDANVFDVGRAQARIRIAGENDEPRDVVLEDGHPRVVSSDGHVDAELIADRETWEAIARHLRDGMAAFRAGRLRIRRDLQLGVGFLAATAPPGGEGRLLIRSVQTAAGSISTMQAGVGEPVILIHGLGGTDQGFVSADDRRVGPRLLRNRGGSAGLRRLRQAPAWSL